MGRLAFLVLVAVLCGSACRAEDASLAAFRRGNALYLAGNYPQAATAYESVTRSGIYSANLFYNLGNTYARLGQSGRAALNYRRALILDPADALARTNLAALPGHPSATGGSWLSRRTAFQDIDLWALLAAGAGWLGLASLCLGRRTAWRLPLAVLGFGFCLFGVWTAWYLNDGWQKAGSAIVVSEHCRMLDTPAADSKVVANLPAGGEVQVLSTQGAWVYAQAGNGGRGWLPASTVEEIDPSFQGAG